MARGVGGGGVGVGAGGNSGGSIPTGLPIFVFVGLGGLTPLWHACEIELTNITGTTAPPLPPLSDVRDPPFCGETKLQPHP